jgi:hypothetical protein
MAVNINDLDLTPESIPEIDFDAPEAGSFAPQLSPGIYDFAFKLADDPYTTTEIKGQQCLVVNYSALTDKEGQEVALNFQRVTSFQNEAMRRMNLQHGVGDLLRALNFRLDGKQTRSRIGEAFDQASNERRHFRGKVEWRRYCKVCEKTISTSPRTKRGDIAWPKAADGQGYELAVACPGCGEKAYGQAQIQRFLLPEGVNGQVKVVTSATGGIRL